MILVATIALLPSWLEGLLNFPIITTGFVMAPRGVGTLVAMLVIGRLLGRVDARAAIAAGLAITAYALWRMTEFNLQTTTTLVVATGIVQGIGIGLIFVPLSTVTFATLDADLRGDATAFYSLVRNVGSSIGISLVESLLATNTQRYHAVLTRHINPFNKLLHWPNVADAYPLDTQAGLAAANAEVTRQAAMIAYLDDFRLLMARSRVLHSARAAVAATAARQVRSGLARLVQALFAAGGPAAQRQPARRQSLSRSRGGEVSGWLQSGPRTAPPPVPGHGGRAGHSRTALRAAGGSSRCCRCRLRPASRRRGRRSSR